jgi:light-regulated signal transduction histidine kinase (bacteriophytochrome)
VTLTCGEHSAESCRGSFLASANLSADIPAILADIDASPIGIFPRRCDDTSVADALTRAPHGAALDEMKREGVCACLCVPFSVDDVTGEFRCDSRTPREPHFELHAAAELFAQLFAMRLEIDRFRNG